MESDFQLFSPVQSSERRSSHPEGMNFPPSTNDESGQDWTQWMRWDDQALPEPPKDNTQSPFDLPLTSPHTSIGQPGSAMQADFSPDISFGFTSSLPFENLPGDRNAMPAPASHNGIGRQSRQTSLSSPISAGMTRKRKTSSDEDGSTVSGLVQNGKKMPSKKRAHNVIEKRYRANLNEKIAELRESVPSLRGAKDPNGNMPDDDDATPASKMNKASILAKATEYIRHLEIRNKRLEDENTALKNRLRQVDKAAEQSMTSTASVSSPSNYTVSTESRGSSSPSVFSHTEDPPSDHSPSSSHPAEGLIKVPDSFKRMREASKQNNIYSQSYIQHDTSRTSSQESGGRRRSNFPNKYMVGALAGLMVLEGMGTEKKTESTEKGLLAVPLNLFNNVQLPSVGYWHAVLRSFWYSWHARAVSHFLVLATLVVGSAFIVFVYLFNSHPGRQYSLAKSTPASDATVLSATNIRRQAWLTSIQRVGVPRHTFFHEWYVVTSRCFEYIVRCFMGRRLFSSVTGITEDDEKGRVKTWDIAIDAQLAGGDAEISKSRLVLTIFAAGTLPRSPTRMMLKALHVRILLWKVGNTGSWSYHVSNDVARKLARYQWEQARQMHRRLPKDHPEALPSHLASLLKIDIDDVMLDSIIQRAANLTWNRPTQEGTDDDEALLDVVEEDPAIQSSLDALAAWWSSHLLQRALLKYFEASSGCPEAKKSRDTFKSQIRLALDVAPQPSAAHTRALVMKAIFFEQDRVENIGVVLAALPSERGKGKRSHASNFLDSSLPSSVREEISIAVRCAMIAAVFTARANDDNTSLPASFTMQRAVKWFNQLPLDPVELTLVGFAAVYHLLHVLSSDTDYLSSSDSSSVMSKTPDSSAASSADDEDEEPQVTRERPLSPQSIPNLGRVASELMYWARNAYNPAFYGFTSDLVEVIEKECISLCNTAGVDVVDYSRVHENKPKSKRKKEKKTKSSSRQSSVSERHVGKQEPPQWGSACADNRETLGSEPHNITSPGSLKTES